MFDMSVCEIAKNMWYILKDELFVCFFEILKEEIPKKIPWDGEDRDPITAWIIFICISFIMFLVFIGLVFFVIFIGFGYIFMTTIHNVVHFIVLRLKRGNA